MSELWDKWKHRLIYGACAWVLLGFVFLMMSVDHPLFSTQTTTKIYKTTSDIILLKWVTKYQTLLAGLAALAGGLSVIMATKIQLLHNDKAASQEKVNHAYSMLMHCANTMQSVYQTLLKSKDPNENLKHLSALVIDINSIDPSLAYLTQSAIKDLSELKFEQYAPKYYPDCIVLAYAVSVIFREQAKIIKEEQKVKLFNSMEMKVPSVLISSIASQHKVDISYFRILRPFIQFPSTSPAAAAPHQPKS